MYDAIYCASGSKSSGEKEAHSSILRAKFRYKLIDLNEEKEMIDRMDLRINGKLLKNYIENKLDVSYTASHNPFLFRGNKYFVEISYPTFFVFGFNLKIVTDKFENLEKAIDLWELDKLIEFGYKPINP